MGYDDPALRHHSNEVAIDQPIGDVSLNAGVNDFRIDYPTAIDGVMVISLVIRSSLFGPRISRESPQMHRAPNHAWVRSVL